MTRQSIATIALAAAAAIVCPGCPALMIPSLAYSGYQYEHQKNQTAPNTQSNKSTSTQQQQQIPDSYIE